MFHHVSSTFIHQKTEKGAPQRIQSWSKFHLRIFGKKWFRYGQGGCFTWVRGELLGRGSLGSVWKAGAGEVWDGAYLI